MANPISTNNEVSITITSSYYENQINKIISKAPIEAGVEILVYMLLDGIVSSKGLSLVDVSSMSKDRAKPFGVKSAVPDMAVVAADFNYSDLKNKKNRHYKSSVFGYVEVKAINKKADSYNSEREAHIKAINHVLCTNGLVWMYFDKKKEACWTIKLDKEERNALKSGEFTIDENRFAELLDRLNSIDWKRKS